MTNMDALVELVYSRWAGHYSKKNWFSNNPLWNELSDDDKQWWKDFVVQIRTPIKKYIDTTNPEEAK